MRGEPRQPPELRRLKQDEEEEEEEEEAPPGAEAATGRAGAGGAEREREPESHSAVARALGEKGWQNASLAGSTPRQCLLHLPSGTAACQPADRPAGWLAGSSSGWGVQEVLSWERAGEQHEAFLDS